MTRAGADTARRRFARRPRPDAALRRRRLIISLCIGGALLTLIALDRSGRLLVSVEERSGDGGVDPAAPDAE